jgi:uncharacterized membrane protein
MGKNKIFEIKNCVIPSGDVQAFKNWLENNDTITNQDLEVALGTAIGYNQLSMVALVNLRIRENNLSLDKEHIKEEIYNTECRQKSAENVNTCISYPSWGEYHKTNPTAYNEIFSVK